MAYVIVCLFVFFIPWRLKVFKDAKITSFPGFSPTRSLGWIGENPGNEVDAKTLSYFAVVF